MDEQMSIDAAQVRKLREERSWSQEHLATIAGVSSRTIQRVESEGTASLETRMAIAAAFGVTPVSLLPVEPAAEASPAQQSIFPGKELGVVCALGGATLGVIYGLSGGNGSAAQYGILGCWIGMACAVTGILVGAYGPNWSRRRSDH